jgi:hypothetical protein
MSVRPAGPQDSQTYAEWLKAMDHINLVDRGVYEYPTCQTLVVERKGEPQLMNSFHAVLVMEALAPKPGISPLGEARALNELFEEVKRVAREAGVREIVFGCKDDSLTGFIENRGFEKLNFSVYRYKL